MAYYPTSTSGLSYISYPGGATVDGVALTANASANTKGAYAQITASTTATTNWCSFITIFTTSTAGKQYLVDLATGAAASEVVVLPNMMTEGTNTGTSDSGAGWVTGPLAIASSTRLSARCQCSTGGTTLGGVAVTAWAAGSMPGPASYANYGSGVTHASGGAQVDPGGTINTKGAYTQLTASSTSITQSLMTCGSIGGATFGTSSPTWCMDISTGAGGAEVVLMADVRCEVPCGSTPRPIFVPRSQTFATFIAASTRLAIRASCDINDATNRLFDILVLGAAAPTEPSGSGGGAWAYA